MVSAFANSFLYARWCAHSSPICLPMTESGFFFSRSWSIIFMPSCSGFIVSLTTSLSTSNTSLWSLALARSIGSRCDCTVRHVPSARCVFIENGSSRRT